MATRRLLLACAVVVYASTLFGQHPPTLKPNPTQPGKHLTPPLALEIQYNSTLPPSYLPIEGADVEPHWMWFTRFVTLPGAPAPEASKKVNAVRITSHWNGETTDIRVTLIRGPQMAHEELVTSYHSGLDRRKQSINLRAMALNHVTNGCCIHRSSYL